MPFTRDKLIPAPTQRERTVVQKETIIREKPIQVLNASLESLTVQRLTATHFSVPDMTIFHPPTPHILNEAFLDFSTGAPSVDLRINNKPFLSYLNDSLHTNNVTSSAGTFRRLFVSNLCVDRIESSRANEIGGVFMSSGHLTVPGNIHADEFVAKSGAIGGIPFSDGKGAFTAVTSKHVSADRVCVADLSCSQKSIELGGVHLSEGSIEASDSCISGVRIHNCRVECDSVNASIVSAHRLDLDGASISSIDDRLSVDVGIVTPFDSANTLGCIRADKSSLIVSGVLTARTGIFQSVSTNALESAEIFSDKIKVGNTIVNPDGISTQTVEANSADIATLVSSEIACSSIKVAEIRADDYKLTDGTSILKGVFPKGLIMLYHGEVAPRGWLVCDGRGGTPRITCPTPGVIYIVRA
jgi:hypothetical protein